MQPVATILGLALAVGVVHAAGKSTVPPPGEDALPGLAASLASRLADKKLKTPDGSEAPVGTFLDATRLTTCLRTISKGDGWPASWLIVVDSTKPYDLVLRIALAADGTIADPETAFFAARRDWDDDAFDAAFLSATGKKPPRERQRNVVIQSFTTKTVTDYVYELPKAGKGAKGLLAFLPEGSLIREAPSVDLGDGKHHTIAIVLIRPRFVPADCTTPEGSKTGHRDAGGVLLVLAGETALEDRLDITDLVKNGAKEAYVPRFTCRPGDEEPGAIDALVDRKLEGREPVRLLDFSGPRAESTIAGLPVIVGVKRENGAFKLFAR